MAAVVSGVAYTRVTANSKRDCRAGAAYIAWTALILKEQDLVTFTNP